MIYPDFEEFIASLHAKRVRYVIIGGHAVAYHGYPRFTKDLDVFVDPSPANAKRFREALRAFFGGTPPGYADSDLLDPKQVIQLGVAPVRIDILSKVSGISSFAVAWSHRVNAKFGAVSAHYLSLNDLIAAKTAAGRAQDQLDLIALARIQRLQK